MTLQLQVLDSMLPWPMEHGCSISEPRTHKDILHQNRVLLKTKEKGYAANTVDKKMPVEQSDTTTSDGTSPS